MEFDPSARLVITIAQRTEIRFGIALSLALGVFFLPNVNIIDMDGDVFVRLLPGRYVMSVGTDDMSMGLGGPQLGKVMLDVIENSLLVGNTWSPCISVFPVGTPYEDVNFVYHEFVDAQPVILNTASLFGFNVKIVDENDQPLQVSTINPYLATVYFEFEFKKMSPWQD